MSQLKTTMIVIAVNLLLSCMYVLSQHAHHGAAVLQSSPLQQSPAGATPVAGELRGSATEADAVKSVQLRELQVGPSRGSISKAPTSKRYHDVLEKPKFLPYTQSEGGRERPKKHQQQQQQQQSADSSGSNGKVSYEIKVYIPRPEAAPSESVPERIAASSEISPSRAEPEYMISPHYAYDDRPPPIAKYGHYGMPAVKPVHDTKPYYYVPVYEDPNAPEPKTPASKLYHPNDREVYKPRLVEVSHPNSPEHKTSEDASRPVTFVEVKPVKTAEPAYPPSYKPKKPLYGTSERPAYDSRDREHGYVRPNTETYVIGDYVPYELQQTTDPPVAAADKETAYYEKIAAEPSYNEVQRSRPRGPDGYGYGSPGYYHSPPPPPPPVYQAAPSYYYVYPYHGNYGQHGSGYYSQNSHGAGGQYRGQHPRPLYSGYGYAAFAPYR
ncbi:uncharacterized protein LOC129584114 isoform X2 [Paramacrobiotus metropolitanus]|uniref:uncharacterized protein LOC129584114 isoform X2 n=1 Tax=Paramacrobiotus metropolitanus TaxID=2943436 RepID=UPI0024463019|nr:uncharacterized protein LOC129584114 isoform X2 [Paramacrobiotus metropolitanus]